MAHATAPDDEAQNDPAHDEQARFEAKVLRSFVRDGRLTAIPAQDRKRRVILRWLMETRFAEDRVYSEPEVNMRLALVHPDVAALRRYLVDAGLMRRSSGEYRLASASSAAGRSAAGSEAS